MDILSRRRRFRANSLVPGPRTAAASLK